MSSIRSHCVDNTGSVRSFSGFGCCDDQGSGSFVAPSLGTVLNLFSLTTEERPDIRFARRNGVTFLLGRKSKRVHPVERVGRSVEGRISS